MPYPRFKIEVNVRRQIFLIYKKMVITVESPLLGDQLKELVLAKNATGNEAFLTVYLNRRLMA